MGRRKKAAVIDNQVLAFTGLLQSLRFTSGADTMLVMRSVFARGQRADY